MASPLDDRSLRDRIFPPWPPRDGYPVRTARVGSWESQFVGLGRLTAFTTDRLLRFSAALDDVGLNVVFLQRHRAEVGLKLLLERAGAEHIPAAHHLEVLVAACQRAMKKAGHEREWDALIAQVSEFLNLLDEVDPRSFTWRYPFDTQERPVDRPPLVDLAELEAEGARFHAAVDDVVDAIAVREGLPLERGEAAAAAAEVAAALRAIATIFVAIDAGETLLAEQKRRLGLSLRDTTAPILEARSSADAQSEVLRSLERPLRRTLALLEAQLSAEARGFDLSPHDVHPPTSAGADAPSSVKAQLDRQVEWTGRTYVLHMRGLGTALRAVYERSATWPGLATRQLHADLGRFLSRFYLNFPADDGRDDDDGEAASPPPAVAPPWVSAPASPW